jgi:hypothetical protein
MGRVRFLADDHLETSGPLGNRLVAGANFVRVGVTREASQAIPISGGLVGNADDPIGMHIDVSVGAVPIR